MAVVDEIEALHHSDQRAVRTVDSLTADQWAGPSLLPGWTRAHVVAHLALNAEAFAGALAGLRSGNEVPIYPSEAQRDADIEELATAPRDAIRKRFFAATGHFRTVVGQLSTRDWEGTVLRLPGGPVWPAAALPGARLREVEVHLADLDAGYSRLDWTPEFAAHLLEQVTSDHAYSPESDPFTVRATDLDRSWFVGAARPVISGTAADLGWWMLGRGQAEGLSTHGDPMPKLGPWRRSPGGPRDPGAS